MPSVMSMYTIYENPRDLPGVRFAVREIAIGLGPQPIPRQIIATAATLEEARDQVPPSADACISRDPADPPGVVETWF